MAEMLSKGASVSLTEWVAFAFAEMAAVYGAKLANQWPAGIGEAKRKLEEALQGYRRAEVARAILALNHTPFPPTVPEFLALCRPRIEFEQAFIEASGQMALRSTGRDQWSHPAIYWAAVRYGATDIQQHNWHQAKTRWPQLLTQALGEELPDVPKNDLRRLVQPGEALTDTVTAHRNLARLKAMLRIRAREGVQ